MPTPPNNANTEFTETQTSLYDPTGHQFVAEKAYNVGTDGTTGIVYGDPATGSGGGGGGGAVADLSTSGTISAAQPTQQSAVANATLVLALGTGQSSFKVELVANAGFTSATTFVIDGSVDGTTWGTKGFKVSGSLTSTTVQSVVGPGPLEITGNCGGLAKVRVRCSVLNGGESITTTLTASVGVVDVGLLSSIPTGVNTIGGVNVVDSAGANKLAVDGAGKIGINALPTMIETNSASIKTDLDTVVTNTNKIPASPAQEGGNLATTATGIGGVADAAYTSGSGSLVSVLKGVFTRLANIVTMAFDNTSRLQISSYGKNSAAGDTAILLDSTGRTLTGRSCTTIYSTTQTGISATADSGDIVVGQYAEISALINVTAFTGTNVTFKIQAKDAFGNYYSVATGAAITAAGTQVLSVGAGVSTNTAFGATIRIQWVCTAVTSATFNLTAQAK